MCDAAARRQVSAGAASRLTPEFIGLLASIHRGARRAYRAAPAAAGRARLSLAVRRRVQQHRTARRGGLRQDRRRPLDRRPQGAPRPARPTCRPASCPNCSNASPCSGTDRPRSTGCGSSTCCSTSNSFLWRTPTGRSSGPRPAQSSQGPSPPMVFVDPLGQSDIESKMEPRG